MSEAGNILNANLLILHSEFPRIGKSIEIFWGHKEFPEYIRSLITDNRADRQGFPINIISALLALQKLHDELYPDFVAEDSNWSSLSY